MDNPRYVIADYDLFEAGGWLHFFTEDGRDVERYVRFVWSLESGSLIAAEVLRDNKWRAASKSEIANLADSLDVNKEYLDPESEECLGLDDELPEWAVDPVPSPV